MSALSEMLLDLSQRASTSYMVKLRQLRAYLEITPDEAIIRQINEIDDSRLLKHLIVAGLRKPLYDAYVQHIQEILLKGGQ